MADSYDSTVTAPAQLAVGVVSGLVLAGIVLAVDSALWWLGVLVAVLAIGVGVYLSTVRVTVSAREITLGQGRGEREPRMIRASEIVTATAEELTWPQCFGFGLPPVEVGTRLTVRPGSTLCLTLRDGEVIRVSTADAPAAVTAVNAARGATR